MQGNARASSDDNPLSFSFLAMEAWPQRRGVKRRAARARPEVESAVGLCALSDRAGLDSAQEATLLSLAQRLGVAVDSPDETCAALAGALGNEWNVAWDSADALAAYAEQAARSRVLLAAAQGMREMRARPVDWDRYPPELKVVIVEQLVESSPQSVVALYETDSATRNLINRLRHPYLVADDDGNLVQAMLPMIDYARMAVATGQTRPLDIFLVSALCTLLAAAQQGLLIYDHNTQPILDGISSRGIGLADFVTLGLTDDEFLRWLDAPYGQEAARNLTQDEMRQVLVGPIAPDLVSIVRLWWQWLAHPFTSPIQRRIEMLLAEEPYTAADRDLSLFNDAVFVEPYSVSFTSAGDTQWRFRKPDVQAFFGGDVPGTFLDIWVREPYTWVRSSHQDFNDNRSQVVIPAIQEAVSADAPAVARRIAQAIEASIIKDQGDAATNNKLGNVRLCVRPCAPARRTVWTSLC
ncbi:hypothetical protein TW95_gp0817 [Pandoravirus inopinatum]|uniref:Uncharacterized protein n=1 Tax=Pandoravirus inopinatum TaxID=1605721 RepID=A0A0B5J9J9_9VIRU|nr:hypothetical protein TW95_gp0817 [Pandoravirus inopinatum]AJF97551.1 hypothetical protein [Pandoravirus inopinatum]